jgi:hypothetical protein
MDVKTILIFKNTKKKVGAIIGVLTFAAISSPFLVGIGWHFSSLEPYELYYSVSFQLARMAMSLFLIGGGLIGSQIGSSLEDFEIIQLEGKSDTEINKIMEDLRKKARVPEFQ